MIKVKETGIYRTMHRLELASYHLDKKMRRFIEELGMIGATNMEPRLLTVEYDGSYELSVPTPYWDGDKLIVSLSGDKVTFIEFGTGLVFPDDHPLAAQNGMIRGEYGKKKAKKGSWVYLGEPGSHGVVLGYSHSRKNPGATVVATQGNPANKILYNAGQEMRNRIQETARKVFNE